LTNPFSIQNLAPTWNVATEIVKGDSQGHPFRGNQYQAGSANAVSLATDANGWLKNAGNLHEAYNTHAKARDAHLAVARNITGQSLAEGDAKNAHIKAAGAHQEAMSLINTAIQGRELGVSPERQAANAASDAALEASQKADEATAQLPIYGNSDLPNR